MSLQAILARIQAAGETQVQEIQARSEVENQAILAEARAEVDRLYQASAAQAMQPIAGERDRMLNQARFEAVCLLGNARERLVEAALASAQAQLQAIRQSSSYPAALRAILLEMLPEQEGQGGGKNQLIIEADPRDQELLERILKDQDLELRIEYNLDCWGGLIARLPDGAGRLVNTLESRFDRVLPYLKKRLAAWFEEQWSE